MNWLGATTGDNLERAHRQNLTDCLPMLFSSEAVMDLVLLGHKSGLPHSQSAIFKAQFKSIQIF